MIPYLELGPLRLPGGFSLEPYGLLAVTAVVVGMSFGAIHAPRHGLSRSEAFRGLWWAVMAGLLAGHAGAILLYEPARLGTEGYRALFDFGSGLSSIAGILGGSIALLCYARVVGVPMLRFLDLLTECFVAGWIFGRLGCALAHDHPGSPTAFPLAVAFPDQPRHDLGLYELAFTLMILAPALCWLEKRGAPEGSRLAAFFCLYGPARFLLDFLRATDLPGSDPRYAGLTPAQYGCIAMSLIGLGVLRHLSSGRSRQEA